MLMSGSPLIKNRLLLLNPPDGADTHTSRRVHPSGRLLRWLLEEEELPSGVGFTPLEADADPLISTKTSERIETLKALKQRLQRPSSAQPLVLEKAAIAVAKRPKCPSPCRSGTANSTLNSRGMVRELRLSNASPL